MDLGLSNRVALVTGASRGIGRSTAELFGAEGARVAITYRSDRAAAEDVAAGIRRAGGQAYTSDFDLATPESAARVVEEVRSVWGPVEILVNNAVAFPRLRDSPTLPFEELPESTWQPLMRENIEGAYRMIQAVLPGMRATGWGRIVTVSSTAARDGMAGLAWYATAKAALHGLTRTVATEAGGDGILANVVMPGATLTDRVREAIPEALLRRHARSLPARRIPGPEEVARVIVFMCAATNTTISGQVVCTGGGEI